MRALLAGEFCSDCHACGYAPGIAIDDDRFTGAVRRLLCRWCNNGSNSAGARAVAGGATTWRIRPPRNST
ncbi:hypothetical protein IU487_31555 [Nocardia puris]|uniref:endonuclease domain-containing protein n=1 Tax=Nocardia puris TaxID=208602 RepID=UPI000DE9093D|nr:hypothetical protein [Nocardia puris]